MSPSPDAERARQFVDRKLSEADTVRMNGNRAGHYGRYVAEIEVDGENLNDMMLVWGLSDSILS